MTVLPSPTTTFSLLLAHTRWAVVWSHLAAIEKQGDHPTRRFQDFESEIDLEALFCDRRPEKNLSSEEIHQLLRKWFHGNANATPRHAKSPGNVWTTWFAAKATHHALKNIYEARCFYGQANPDNLLRRFKRLFSDSAYRAQRDTKSDGPSAHILEWGDVGFNLVKHNQGWKHFSRLQLSEIKDPLDPARNPAHSDSFIQRVLHLGRNRYLQILAPPVGPVFLLFLIRYFIEQRQLAPNAQDDAFAAIRELSKGDGDPLDLRRLTASADDTERLFIDISHQCGRFQKFPYPFGVADRAVIDEFGDTESDWEPHLITKVRERVLEDGESWSPPLLVCQRSDQVAFPDFGVRRRAVRCLRISDPCPFYATVYVPTLEKSDGIRSVLGQRNSWADPVGAAHFSDKYVSLTREQLWERTRLMARRNSKGEMFLAYFPLDLPLRDKCPPLRPRDIYALKLGDREITDQAANDLMYVLPGAVLASGPMLAAQPRMPVLLKHFGRLLWNLELFCRSLSAPPEEIARFAADLTNIESRSIAAGRLAERNAERGRDRLERLYPNAKDRHFALLKALLISAGWEMCKSLKLNSSETRLFDHALTDWGWAILLQFLDSSSVDFSGEMILHEDLKPL